MSVTFKTFEGHEITIPDQVIYLPTFKQDYVVRVHGGKMHADEIVSIALLRSTFGSKIRVIDTPGEYDLAVDCEGDLNFRPFVLDHHQKDYPLRSWTEGRHAACGLVWEVFKDAFFMSRDITEPQEQDVLTLKMREFLREIEDVDNGVAEGAPKVTDLTHLLSCFNVSPTAQDAERLASFNQAVAVAGAIIEKMVSGLLATVRAYAKTKWYIQQSAGKVISLPGVMPWKAVLDQEPKLFDNFLLVTWTQMREGEEQFYVQTLPISGDQPFSMRVPAPIFWRGKRNEQLARDSGIEDAIFCHPAGFLTVARSRAGQEQIIQALLRAAAQPPAETAGLKEAMERNNA